MTISKLRFFVRTTGFGLVIIILLPIGCVSEITLLSNAGYIVDDSSSRVSSWQELNEQNVVMQHYDYSCGAASLATLMKYYFNDDIDEQKLLDYIKGTFDEQTYLQIEKDGLSFLDLEIISRSLGYQTASVRLKPSALLELQGPVIVYLNTRYYRHFAVFRGVYEDRIFLADPSRGNIRLTIDEFLKEWNGETFVLGKNEFGLPKKHNLLVLHSAGFRNELELLWSPLITHPEKRIMRLR